MYSTKPCLFSSGFSINLQFRFPSFTHYFLSNSNHASVFRMRLKPIICLRCQQGEVILFSFGYLPCLVIFPFQCKFNKIARYMFDISPQRRRTRRWFYISPLFNFRIVMTYAVCSQQYKHTHTHKIGFDFRIRIMQQAILFIHRRVWEGDGQSLERIQL